MTTRLWRLLASFLAFSLVAAACGDDDDDAADTSDSAAEETSDDDMAEEEADDDMAEEEADDDMAEEEADDDMAEEEADDDMAEEEADDDMAEEGCSEITDVTAATVNPNDLLNYSINEGIFESYCLNVSLAEGLNGPGIVAGLAAGEIDFGFVAGVPVATSVTNAGQPIRIVSVRTAAVEGNDFVVLLANSDSGVTGPADFEGKNIGIRSPGSLCTVMIKQAMINAGIEDPNNAATYIQGESNGDLAEQLRAGDIDVTCFVYPFAGSVVGDENIVVVGNTLSAYPNGIPVGVTAVNDEWGDANADLVDAWNAALSDTAAFANEDEARWRELLPTISSMNEDQAASSILALNVGGGPVGDWDFTPIWESVEALGLTDGPVDVDGVFG